MRPLKLIIIVGIMVLGLLILKTLVHLLGFEIIALTGLVTALIGGVTFTISILVAGTMPDYKESEKIPGELAASLKSLFKDSRITAGSDKKMSKSMMVHVKGILDIIIDNFRSGKWKQKEINERIDALDDDIAACAHAGAQANYISRMRTELTNVERLSNRVETIRETSFLPTANTIAKLIVVLVLGLLLFVKVEPFYEALAIISIIGYLLIGLLFLMKDIDNPFEGDKGSAADVDLEHIFKTQKYMKEHLNSKI